MLLNADSGIFVFFFRRNEIKENYIVIMRKYGRNKMKIKNINCL